MPLPSGSNKTNAQLRADGDLVWKTNGGSSLVKTIGSSVRQFIADLLESVVLRRDAFVVVKTGSTITFERDALFFASTNLDILSSDLTIDLSNAKSGTVVRVYCKGASAPTLTIPPSVVQTISRLEPWNDDTINPQNINIYTFVLIGRGSNWVLDITRTQAQLNAI